LDSSDSGSSAVEEIRSTKMRSPSISRRTSSGLTLKREKISLMMSSPSRRMPSSRCSDSITLEPSLEASYRAKKSARRAFSLYFSNIAGVSRQVHFWAVTPRRENPPTV
jgi:hypothetical protein